MTTSSDRAAEIAALLGKLAHLMADAERPARESPSAAPPPRVLLTVEEAAERLGIGKTKTYELVRSGSLRSVQIGRLRRIHVDAVAEYAASLVAVQNAAA
ncbi:excisionase [Pseudonocardia sp. CNS-139]|nr:excisionase [Pseudonocardia sp. CNS-139]